jgi:hypothetical protein
MLIGETCIARKMVRRTFLSAILQSILVCLMIGSMPTVLRAAAPTPEGLEFFEKKIRPLFAERCYKCHSAQSEKLKGGLRLDTREAILKGGDTRAAITPGDPEKSLLIEAVRYKNEDLQMPPKERLTDQQVADLIAWIKMGVPDPRTEKAQPAPPAYNYAEAKKFWSFQPPRDHPIPAVKQSDWPRSPIDRFILARLEASGLSPAAAAEKRTLIRRATFDLIGLPPSPAEVDAFLTDKSPDAFAKVVDRLLASPQYGERWARHWLDVVRYTDSFDARITGNSPMDINEAWRYRDWVVDSFNRDLPYDQFVMNQIAGDLLPPSEPGGINRDGIIATGVMAIGNWGGGDADKEKLLTDIVDDQIDVVGRAFLGLTLACARCHDHKFDPIPTEDYYSLAGIFFSSHILPNVGLKTNGPEMLRIPLVSRAELEQRKKDEARVADLQKQIEQTIDDHYSKLARKVLPHTDHYLLAAWALRNHTIPDALDLDGYALKQWYSYLDSDDLKLLTLVTPNVGGISGVAAWRNAGGADTPSITINASAQTASFSGITIPPRTVAVHPSPKAGVGVGWKSPIAAAVEVRGRVVDADPKCGDGIAWSINVRSAGATRQLASGEIPNAGVQKFSDGKGGIDLASVAVSPGDMIEIVVLPKGEYTCDTTIIELEIIEREGQRRAWNLARDVVPAAGQGLKGNPHEDSFGNAGVWHFYDLAGQSLAGELPADSALGKWLRLAVNPDAQRGQVNSAAAEVQRALDALDAQLADLKKGGKDASALKGPDANVYRELTSPRGRFWAGARSDEKNLPAQKREAIIKMREEIAGIQPSLAKPIPIAEGIQEGGCPDSPQAGIHDVKVHIRGRYDRLAQLVPRRFPRVLAGEDQKPIGEGSGRMQLARWLVNPGNPLTARVMVNRIWQHHFGEGLVRTPNNYGKLGQPPTHPELLDYLALEFERNGWSIKAMHRAIMLSATYQQSSVPQTVTLKADPDNLLFGRVSRQRLDAEGLRDSLLAVTDSLDLSLHGPAIRDFNTTRRTLYVMTIRSDRANYRSLFDAADPTAIIDKRIDSTVAPQALFMLNHPFALDRTRALAGRAMKTVGDNRAKIGWLYQRLYARPPREREIAIGLEMLQTGGGNELAWERYCQVLLCANEFVYVD